MALQGGKIAGGNPERGRVEYDYYATNPKDVSNFLKTLHRDGVVFPGSSFLEPCTGGGHIVEACKSSTYLPTGQQWTTIDLVDRGYPLSAQGDFLLMNFSDTFDGIITNPPFALAAEFIDKCMHILSEDGMLAMFLKIQFLEGENRRELFHRYPPRYVYVLRSRTSTWNNGMEFNPDNGKPWAGVITYCWYVWQKGSTAEPVIRWVDESDTSSKRKSLF